MKAVFQALKMSDGRKAEPACRSSSSWNSFCQSAATGLRLGSGGGSA